MDELNRMSADEFRQAKKIPVILILDNIRSGYNVGSIFRTADAFRIREIICCGYSASPPNRDVMKTALGATESVHWKTAASALDTISDLKKENWKIFALEQTTASIPLINFLPETGFGYAFILGNEVSGVDTSLLEQCDGAIEIPQFGTKHSMNVAVSAGILLWEIQKKISDRQ